MTIRIVFLFFFILANVGLRAQNTADRNRQYVCNKLVFYYVDDPSVAMPANISTIEVDKRTIYNGQDITTPLWSNADNAGLKDILIALLRDSAHGGDLELQRCVRNVLLVSDKQVYVYLYHDTGNQVHHASMPIYATSSGSFPSKPNACWPSGTDFANRKLRASGHFGIGSYFFSTAYSYAGGVNEQKVKRSVVIHELLHTQLALNLESTLTPIEMYGNDGHNRYEMIPSRNSAFDEGLANAFAYCYHRPATHNLTNYLNNNTELFADSLAAQCPTGNTNVHCLQDRLAAAGVTAQSPCWASGAACYNIQDVPARYLMNCETVSANVMYYCTQQFESEMILVRAVRAMATQIRTTPGSTFAPVFREMVARGNNYSNTGNPAGVATHGQHLPMAILDYCTGYKLDSKASLEAIIGGPWRPGDTDISGYFTRHRPTFLGYRANATTWDIRYLDKFAIEHLHVRSGTP